MTEPAYMLQLPARRSIKRQTRQSIVAYLMIALPLIGFFVFILYPMLWAAFKSLYYYNGIISEMKYVGLDNFIGTFRDKVYWTTWIVTFKFAVWKLIFEIPIALILAVILNRKMKFSGIFSSVFFLPTIISVAVVGVIFSIMFDYFGTINELMIRVGIIKVGIDWLANSKTALAALVIGSVWQTFGINVMYFLAALQNVPEDCYEAAKLDGANAGDVFFKVTLPLISPVTQTILLLAINGTLHTCEYILVASNGAPGGSTFTVMSYVVKTFLPGFAGGVVNIGYGCAISIVTSVIYCIIAVAYLKFSKKMSTIY